MDDYGKLLDELIYTFMARKNLHNAAETFAREANIDDDELLDVDDQVFLDWWSIFPFHFDGVDLPELPQQRSPTTYFVFADDHAVGGPKLDLPEMTHHCLWKITQFIHTYMVRNNLHQAAEKFAMEANMDLTNVDESLNDDAHHFFMEQWTLYIDTRLNDDTWEITKILSQADVDHNRRLRIGEGMARRHILPHVKLGNKVNVWDLEFGKEYQLTFSKRGNGYYVFAGGWRPDFVTRRNLKVGDEVGFRWDENKSRLEFMLLSRAH